MSEKPKLEYVIHNCHVHLFSIDYIPKYFLHSMVPVTVVKNHWIASTAYRLFRNKLNRYSAFFYAALRRTPKDILEELRYYYPRRTKFVPLTVDFEFMEAGPCERGYLQQLEDIAALKQEFPDKIYPFICSDPRRENVLDLVKDYIENKGFSGIKLYPALGYFLDDERLFPVYEYAEKNELPITTHCIPKNKNHYRGKITDAMRAKALQTPGATEHEVKSNYDFAQFFNHPYWLGKNVLPQFPNLKINFGHFGGNTEWDRYLDNPYNPDKDAPNWYAMIRDLIENKDYPNIYSDISFTVFDQKLYPLLKNLIKSTGTRDYVLFGSDFYMLQKDYRERRFGLDVRGYLDDEDYWQIAEINPKRFLANKIHEERSVKRTSRKAHA